MHNHIINQFIWRLKYQNRAQWRKKSLFQNKLLENISELHMKCIWFIDGHAQHNLPIVRYWSLFPTVCTLVHKAVKPNIFSVSTSKNWGVLKIVKSCLFGIVSFIEIGRFRAILYWYSPKKTTWFLLFFVVPNKTIKNVTFSYENNNKIAKNHPILMKFTVQNRQDFAIFKTLRFFEFW